MNIENNLSKLNNLFEKSSKYKSKSEDKIDKNIIDILIQNFSITIKKLEIEFVHLDIKTKL